MNRPNSHLCCFCYRLGVRVSEAVQLVLIVLQGDVFVGGEEREYLISFCDRLPIRITGSIELLERSAEANREYFYDLAFAGAQMVLRDASIIRDSDLPAIVSSSPVPLALNEVRARLQLNYQCLTHDPGYLAARSSRISIDRLFGETLHLERLPEHDTTLMFEPMDHIPVSISAPSEAPNAVVRINSIDSDGVADVTVFRWENTGELSFGTEIVRSGHWEEASPIHEQSYSRSPFAVFGQVVR